MRNRVTKMLNLKSQIMTKRMLQPMQLIEVKLLLLFKGDFILILLFIFGHSGQVNRGPKKHVSFLESSKDSSPLVISDSLTIDNSIMASFECTAEFDIELIELIKQHIVSTTKTMNSLMLL